MTKVSLYIADDHQIIIDGLRLLLEGEQDIQIVGYAISGAAAYNDILKINPELAIVDMRMPEKSGLQLIQQLQPKVSTKFIMLTMQAEKRLIADAKNYGARALLLKNTGKEELVRCIRKVIANEVYFPIIKSEPNSAVLSPRELDILNWVIKGFTTIQIAKELNLSHFTVETHRKNIYRKTNATNIAGLIEYAQNNDLYHI
jgi:DNA-binding NarL/FixJ family response regulator